MHIVSNIRNLEKFLGCFPWAASDVFNQCGLPKLYSSSKLRAHHYDLVIARVVQGGATITETRDGKERELVLGEWMIAPLVGRESTLGHSSVLPREGIPIGAVIDVISTGGGFGVSVDNPMGKGDPTKVEIRGILRYEGGAPARALDFSLNMRASLSLLPVIAVVGSRSDAGKTTACLDVIRNLHDAGKKVGVAKLSGTAQRKEILELAIHAHQFLDTADAGLPTTYPPSQDIDERTQATVDEATKAAERILQELSIDNDVIVVEFGGDLLSASVPEIIADPSRLNIVSLVMAAESATAAIGMEAKLLRISRSYDAIPKYVVGPSANLRANRNRVMRETNCAGCYDLWSKTQPCAQRQIDSSRAATADLTKRLLGNCRF